MREGERRGGGVEGRVEGKRGREEREGREGGEWKREEMEERKDEDGGEGGEWKRKEMEERKEEEGREGRGGRRGEVRRGYNRKVPSDTQPPTMIRSVPSYMCQGHAHMGGGKCGIYICILFTTITSTVIYQIIKLTYVGLSTCQSSLCHR